MVSLDQIKQRKIVHWAVAYVAASWLVLQVSDLVWDIYGWSPALLRLLPALLGIGLLIVIVLVWFHGEKGAQRVGAVELLMLAGILVIAGGVMFMVRGRSSAVTGDVVQSKASGVESRSIAVLPFTDMSPHADQAYFSDGLTEELLNVLAQIPALHVAARTSSFSFRDSKVSIDSIARALRVEYVLEGSVRTAGENVRITAQLIKAGTGYHVWSNTYDRRLQDIFAVQGEISRAIVAALRLKIGSGTAALPQADSTDPETHALVLRAEYALHRQDEGDIRRAVELLQQAVARDPRYARAWAALAKAQSTFAYRRYGPFAEGYAQATKSARRALELDPGSAQAHVELGRIADTYEWDFVRANQHFARAIELNPGLADAYSMRAWLLMRLGDTDSSLAAAQHATLLDPVSPSAHNGLGCMYAYAGDYPRSKDALHAALELDPNGPIIPVNLALTFAVEGQADSALAYATRAADIAPDEPYMQATLGYVYGLAGRRADAERQLAKLAQMTGTTPYLLAMIYAGLRKWDEAFVQLDRAITERDDLVVDVGVDDVFEPVKKDPRMKRLLERIGLPEPPA